MSKNGVIIVSHSSKIGEGLVDLIDEMVTGSDKVTVVSASGTEDGRIGTTVSLISEAFDKCKNHENIFVFYDIGSSKMSAEIAIELANQDNIILVEAPIVEGAFAGAITASVTTDYSTILEEIKKSNS